MRGAEDSNHQTSNSDRSESTFSGNFSTSHSVPSSSSSIDLPGIPSIHPSNVHHNSDADADADVDADFNDGTDADDDIDSGDADIEVGRPPVG